MAIFQIPIHTEFWNKLCQKTLNVIIMKKNEFEYGKDNQ
jgi:hypothetical protein